jgi:hypothetical protein
LLRKWFYLLRRRLSAKLVPNSADRGCHVVSVTDSYGRILGFLDRTCCVNPRDNTHYAPITATPSTRTKYSHKILHLSTRQSTSLELSHCCEIQKLKIEWSTYLAELYKEGMAQKALISPFMQTFWTPWMEGEPSRSIFL